MSGRIFCLFLLYNKVADEMDAFEFVNFIHSFDFAIAFFFEADTLIINTTMKPQLDFSLSLRMQFNCWRFSIDLLQLLEGCLVSRHHFLRNN